MTKPTWKLKFGLNVVSHVTILFLALTILFIAVIKNVEKDALQGEFVNAIHNGLSQSLEARDKKSNGKLKESLLPMEEFCIQVRGLYTLPDKATETYNNLLLVIAFSIIGLLVCVSITIILCFQLGCGVSILKQYGYILLENLWIFILVLPIEVIFFLKVASHYVPGKPSAMITRTINDLKAF